MPRAGDGPGAVPTPRGRSSTASSSIKCRSVPSAGTRTDAIVSCSSPPTDGSTDTRSPGESGLDVRAEQAEPIRWDFPMPGVDSVLLQEPCWPSDPAFGGCLLISVIDGIDLLRPYWRPQVWWIRLDPDGTAVVAAGLMFDPNEGSPRVNCEEVRFPVVGRADGAPFLAYLAREENQAGLALWVTMIGRDTAIDGSKTSTLTCCKLTEGCRPMEPAFSADGRWLYASVWVGRPDKFRLKRFALPPVKKSGASPGCDLRHAGTNRAPTR